MMRLTCLQLVLFVQGLLQSVATTQCESDQIAQFQAKPKVEVLKGALEQEVTGRSCDQHSFNGGVCGKNECQGCDYGNDQEIPTNASKFPFGKLTCGENACSYGSQYASYVYDFKNPSDYLDCGGLRACFQFRAKDVAGLCCLGACHRAHIQLASTGGDVCCKTGTSNQQACNYADLKNVRSMACFGNNMCQYAEPTLTGDLVLSGSFAGQDAKFTFNGASHCIRSVDATSQRPFLRATFTFEKSSNIMMQCDGSLAPCQDNTVKLPEGSCLHVKCDSPDPDGCHNFRVIPSMAGKENFECYCSGVRCGWTSGFSYCSITTENPCGTAICPGTLPRCVKDETAVTAKSVDCTRLAAEAPAQADAGTVQGDPHLRTLDGRHYTLMQQGNFLLWSFSGYETDILVEESVRKVPLDFEILAHYAGHASFTKGLLFVDKSSMSKHPQALEVTAKDCSWHHRDAGASSWRPVESVLLNLADSDGIYGSFNLSMSKGSQRKLEISINQGGKVRTLAQLWVSCKAGHQLSAKIKMPWKKDLHFVTGELAPGRLSLAATGEFEDNQMATDPEFALTSDWGDLGGSPTAASYFTAVDATGPAGAFKECGEAEKAEHAKTCKKHLADSAASMGFWYQQVMTDCMFDLCHGGDETSAELAAEILNA